MVMGVAEQVDGDTNPDTSDPGTSHPDTSDPGTAASGAMAPTFDVVYAAEFLPLVRLATLMCGRVEVARDIVPDAFVALHRRWATVDQPSAYVRRSVVNGCRSHARWERRRRGRPVEDEPTAADEVTELFDVLARLPHRQRAAIVLRFYEGRSEAEIAEMLRCRPGTVGPLITRGLRAMRDELTTRAEGP
jgi:RNA polymerase sigma factor (sigma-70 family)